MLGFPTSLPTFKKIKLIQSIFSSHIEIILEINSRKGEDHRHKQIKWSLPEQPMGQRKKLQGNEKLSSGKMKIKTYCNKIYGI